LREATKIGTHSWAPCQCLGGTIRQRLDTIMCCVQDLHWKVAKKRGLCHASQTKCLTVISNGSLSCHQFLKAWIPHQSISISLFCRPWFPARSGQTDTHPHSPAQHALHMLTLKTWHVSAGFGTYEELCMHLPSWAYLRICVLLCWGLSMHVGLFACIEDWTCYVRSKLRTSRAPDHSTHMFRCTSQPLTMRA
jgi:hypothetical protein